MLNINEKMEYTEEVGKKENFAEETKNQYEFYNSNYNVNFFGAGPEKEDWQ
ncbi:hypothetical protein [Clostridium sp.]|uniref:hypothetical protein n=1 Tax=Clostridium sp. TaxID=1506 RepID=UPI001A47A980|nr:hypothetical protein [Clostridium sp.]MBK5241748.1 hypothetical protein [Clostridium sp.]